MSKVAWNIMVENKKSAIENLDRYCNENRIPMYTSFFPSYGMAGIQLVFKSPDDMLLHKKSISDVLHNVVVFM